LLPKLVDQARKGPKQAFFHMCLHRAKALVMGLIRLTQGRQARLPLAQRLVLCVRDIPQVGFRHPGNCVRWRQRVQQHPGVFGDEAIQLVRESSPHVGIAGEKRLDRHVCAVAVHRAVAPGDDVLTAAAAPEEVLKIVLHGPSRRYPGSFLGTIG